MIFAKRTFEQENLFLYSQELDNAGAWTAVGTTVVTANNVAAPDGTMTADKLVHDGGVGWVQQATTLDVAKDVGYSIWLRADAPVTYKVTVGDANDGVPAYFYDITVTPAWQRFSFPCAATVDSTTGVVILLGVSGGYFTGTVYAWGGQLNRGLSAYPYVKTTSAAATYATYKLPPVIQLPTWSPGTQESLTAWYAPDSMTVTTGKVSAWADKSGSAFDLSQATSSKRPVYDTDNPLNGYVGALFDGSDDYLSGAAAFAAHQSYTVAAVVVPTQDEPSNGYAVVVNKDDFSTGFDFRTGPTVSVINAQVNAGIAADAMVLEPQLWLATFGAGVMHLWINGVEQTLTTPPASLIAPGADAKIAVGSFFGVVPAFIRIFEVMVCGSVLSPSDREAWTKYLMDKYGL